MNTEINKDTANNIQANDDSGKGLNVVPDAIWLVVVVAIMIGAEARYHTNNISYFRFNLCKNIFGFR